MEPEDHIDEELLVHKQWVKLVDEGRKNDPHIAKLYQQYLDAGAVLTRPNPRDEPRSPVPFMEAINALSAAIEQRKTRN